MADNRPKRGNIPMPVDLEKVKEMAAIGMTEDAIARICGFNPNYWYTDLKRSRPDISEAVRLGRSQGQQRLLNELLEQATERKNLQAIIFALKSQHGFRDNTSIELTGPGGAALQVEHVLLPPEERKIKLQELKQLESADDDE